MLHLIHALVKTDTATASGRRIVRNACDRCQTIFFYEMWRSAKGTASGIRFVSERGTHRRAQEAADANLSRRLRRESEMVACPKCNWVNQALVNSYRRRYRAVPWIVLFVAILFCSAAIGADAIASATSRAYDIHGNHTLVQDACIGIFLAALPAGFLFQMSLKLRIHPNLTYPAIPVLPPGSPPALTAETHPTEVIYSAAGQSDRDGSDTAATVWAYFRLGQLLMPSSCCCCMAKPTTMYSRPAAAATSEIRVSLPLCTDCAKRIRSAWRRVAMHSVLGAVAVCWLASILIPGLDDVSRWFLFGIATLFTALIAVLVVPHRLTRPYQIRRIDKTRGIYGIRTQNAEFTGLMASMLRKAAARIAVPLTDADDRT